MRGFWVQALNHGGDGTFTYTLGNWDSSWTVVPADLDGDGLTDMFVYNFTNGVWVKCFVDGSGGFKGYAVGNWDPGWTFSTADLNGDGRDDFFLYNRTNGVWVEAFSQAGFGDVRLPGVGAVGSGLAGRTRRISTAMGATDLFLLNAAGVHVSALSRAGGGFDYVGGPQWAPGWTVAAGDLNGDGRTDLFLYNPANGFWAEAFSDGSGGFTSRRRDLGSGLDGRRDRLQRGRPRRPAPLARTARGSRPSTPEPRASRTWRGTGAPAGRCSREGRRAGERLRSQGTPQWASLAALFRIHLV